MYKIYVYQTPSTFMCHALEYISLYQPRSYIDSVVLVNTQYALYLIQVTLF